MTAQRSGDFYQTLRRRMSAWLRRDGKGHKWAEYLMLAPDFFHLLCKLTVDPDVPVKEKAKLAAAIAYFVSPLDLIPEAIVGPGGYVDDVAFAAYVLRSIMRSAGPEVVRRHWAGDGDVIQQVERVLRVAETMVGAGLWQRLKRLAGAGRR
jgi:uncharacterized membrane protein YkvA (DUF1232 family)